MFRQALRCGVALAAVTAVLAWGVNAFAQAKGPQEKGGQSASHHDHDHTIKMTVKGMCCAKEAEPVAKELEKVKGVDKVKTDPKTGVITITPNPKKEPSPKELWEAAERAKIQVVKLAMAHDEFTKKPKK